MADDNDKPLLHAPEGERFLTETEFWEEFVPTKKESGDLLDFEDVKDTPPENVWTIVESGNVDEDGGDDENWYALPGFHRVNVIGYVTSVFPWTDLNIAEAIYFDADDFKDENDDD
jgi:hypothetical protein